MKNISTFDKIFESAPSGEIDVLSYLNMIKSGVWIDKIIDIRGKATKEERDAAKKGLPAVTASGTFERRAVAGLKQHSGFILIDLDHLADAAETLARIAKDKYVFAAYRSASGAGLAVWVRIVPDKHLEAFLGLERYFANTYGLIADPACKDVSRARFASYDPDLVLNEGAETFKEYVEKKQILGEKKRYIFGSNDIQFILDQIQRRGINIAPDYASWIRTAYALSSLGAEGRAAFEIVSNQWQGKQSTDPGKQFERCAKSAGHGITIGTFFYYCKQAGIDIHTPNTKKIKIVGIQRRKSNATVADAAKYLNDIEGITAEESEPVLQQIWAANMADLESEDVSILDTLGVFIKSNFDLKRNEIDRLIEVNGKQIDTYILNSIYIQALREVSDKLNYNLVERLVYSDFTPTYNPIRDFINAHRADPRPGGLIAELAACMDTADPKYTEYFLRKWLAGIAGSALGTYSITTLVLVGGQGENKTNFFRNLLPSELSHYYAESKLDQGKDDEIQMTRKLIIMDDEYGGKSKQEVKKYKDLSSKAVFSLREPYGRAHVELKRLAVLAGTTNENEILNDYTGNRRVIPIRIRSIDFERFQKIDKTALFMEMVEAAEAGGWFLTKSDIAYLAECTTEFRVPTSELELVNTYFTKPDPFGADPFSIVTFETVTNLRVYVENATNQRLNGKKFTEALHEVGFESKMKKINGVSGRYYAVIKNKPQPEGDDAPKPMPF